MRFGVDRQTLVEHDSHRSLVIMVQKQDHDATETGICHLRRCDQQLTLKRARLSFPTDGLTLCFLCYRPR